MPNYDYDCDTCGVFEVFQMMSAKKFEECPKCGSKKIKRLIGAGLGIIFKGTGFYETDYKRKEKSSESKTDSKPETKTEKPVEPVGTGLAPVRDKETKTETKLDTKKE